MAVQIRERGTKLHRTVEFSFPALSQWDAFCADAAAVMVRLTTDVGDVPMPDSVKALQEKGAWRAWCYALAGVKRIKVVRDEVRRIFVTYLDPMVDIDGEPSEDSIGWIDRHATINDALTMLLSILVVDEYVEKKSHQAMAVAFSWVKPPYSSTSQRSPTSPSPESGGGASSRPGYISLAHPNERLN